MNPNTTGPFMPGQLATNMTPIFHRRNFAAAAVLGAEVVFFGETSGVGGIGPELTNMTRAFELENPREMNMVALRVCSYDTTAADWMKIVKNYTLRFFVGGILQLDAPVDYWAGGMGMNTQLSNGIGDPKAIQGLMPHPIRIPYQTSFSARLVGTSQTVAAAAMIGIFLDGPFDRPIG